MKPKFLLAIVVGVLLMAAAGTAQAVEASPRHAVTGAAPAYLCPPRLQLRRPGACPSVGLGGAINDLASKGLYPPAPLPTVGLDPNLSYVPWDYLRVGDGATSLYTSPQDALASSGPRSM